MSEGRLDKSPSHHKEAASTLTYPVRRMRNTAVLVKWIEEHQSNPYPTKAEKQYLAYYSGMNLTQLSTWFANARRRIKKIGMKTWLEGRSTFTVDFFPSPTIQAPAIAREYPGISTASPYPYQLQSATNYGTQQHQASLSPMQPASQRMPHGVCSSLIYSEASPATASMQQVSSTAGLYGRPPLPPTMMAAMPTYWSAMPTTPLLPSTSVSVQSRSCGSNAAPMHSPITAQVYSADLRTHSGQLLEVSDGTYTPPQQHSPPEHMLPECASSEPLLQDSQKSQSAIPS